MARIEIAKLYITPVEGAGMVEMDSVHALAGKGIDGDRYAIGIGFWQTHGVYRDRIRHGTIFFTEHLMGTGFKGIDTRRNIELTGDMNPLDLLGRKFRFGDVLMQGIWDCSPCNRPSKLSGVQGFEKLPKERGGVRVEFLESGVLKPGLPIVFV